jgi:hypothetical protein
MQRSAAARNVMGGRVYSIEGTWQVYHEDGRRIVQDGASVEDGDLRMR